MRAKENELLILLLPLYAVLLSALQMFSCGAGRSAQEITVKVPDQFAGELQISPCEANGAPDPVIADSQGAAKTSVCPKASQPVTLAVLRGGQTYRIAPENVTVRRSGDGLPVSIRARVPAQ